LSNQEMFWQAILMSIIENYRSSQDYREILRVLQKSTSLQENFLWQTQSNGRSIIPIHHFEIDFVTREVVIYFDKRKFKIDQSLPLYVKLDYRMTVFKVSDFIETAEALHFGFPKEIRALELRGTNRIALPTDPEHSVALKPSLGGNLELGNEIKVRVSDVSQSGIGLIVSDQNRSFLRNNRILWVTALGDHRLITPILAEIVYMNAETDVRSQSKRPKEFKVGLKLSGMIPTDAFKSFLQ
jgi:hypothetical protein